MIHGYVSIKGVTGHSVKEVQWKTTTNKISFDLLEVFGKWMPH